MVVVTRKLPAEVEAELQKDFDARLNPDDTPLTPEQLQEALRTADAILPTVTDKFTAEVLATEPLRAKLLANFGVGFNHIDVAAAKARGLSVRTRPTCLPTPPPTSR